MNVAEEVQTITLTSTAADKLGQLLLEKSKPNYGLRVFVAGGGCSGMQYGMTFEPQPQEFDTVIEGDEGVRLFVDPTSLMYLEGATIDYVDSLMGGGFRIDNPQAVSTCGCGHSFRTASAGGAASGNGGGCGCQ